MSVPPRCPTPDGADGDEELTGVEDKPFGAVAGPRPGRTTALDTGSIFESVPGELVADPDDAVGHGEAVRAVADRDRRADVVRAPGRCAVTVPSRLFATQTAPTPVVNRVGTACLPAIDGSRRRRCVGRACVTRSGSPELVTQTEPKPTATPSALWPTGIVR